jgi:hypothetical protein
MPVIAGPAARVTTPEVTQGLEGRLDVATGGRGTMARHVQAHGA